MPPDQEKCKFNIPAKRQPQSTEARLTKSPECRNHYLKVYRYGLTYIGEDSIPVLLLALPKSDKFTQRQIVSVLAKLPPIKEPSAIHLLLPLLVPLLAKGHPTGKNAAKLIAKCGEHVAENVIETMVAILRSGKMPDATNAIHVVKRISGENAVAVLIDALDHQNVVVRRHAAQALISRGDAHCARSLVQALLDPDDGVCFYSAIALRKFAGPEAIPVLKQVLKNARGRYFRKRPLDRTLQKTIECINDRASRSSQRSMRLSSQ